MKCKIPHEICNSNDNNRNYHIVNIEYQYYNDNNKNGDSNKRNIFLERANKGDFNATPKYYINIYIEKQDSKKNE